MKKKFVENKKFRLVVILSVAVLLVLGATLAWFFLYPTDANQQFSVANFQAEPVCYFEGSEEKFIDEDGLITLSTNPEDANYIGKFCVDVKYKGDGAGYLRVKMVHEYSINGNSTQHPANVPYTVSNDWYDNRGNDYCYYYKNELDANGDTEQTLNFIAANNAINLGELADGIVIKVAVETDMVQVNRYPQVWGIDKLPWK
ncbi:MAG: hypothetical protein IJ279_00415 [Clostridia bacterium]|nr:hypothetical protein [Clostridia bacterium]